MVRFLRRLVWLFALGATAALVARWWSARSVPAPATAPSWPPFGPVSASASASASASTSASPATATAAAPTSESGPAADDATRPDDATHPDDAGHLDDASVPVQALVATPSDTIEVAVRPAWVLPIDGVCPPGYPVKANDNSGIFHVPGGRFYDRTKPERCYVDAAAAAADGYRAAKA